MAVASKTSSLSLFRIGDVAYYASQISTSIHLDPYEHNSADTPGPCTVIVRNITSPVTPEFLQTTIDRFNQEDDVWSRDFLETVIFVALAVTELADDVLHLAKAKGVKNIYTSTGSLPEGPYWLSRGALNQVYRLYPDTAEAFIVSTIPSANDSQSYETFEVSAYSDTWPSSLTIAVPSRLYFTKTEKLPFAGMRVAVKDNQDLSGIRTGASSRAFTKLYGPRDKTAASVHKLLALGAVVVGKTRTTQFGDTEWATGDWVDYHAPFNPRADGYQGPSGSSAGSGAGLATYPWLDLSTGTDSCGSIRSPAAVQGLFTMRPSLGVTDLEGVIPWSPLFDSLGVFSRDLDSYVSAAKILHAGPNSQLCSLKPKKILYPLDFWPLEHAESQAVFDDFIGKLESFLGVKKTEINLTEMWKKSNPVNTELPLEEYFYNTLPYVYALDQFSFYENFAREYMEAFGEKPYFNPQGQFRFEWAPNMTEDMREKGVNQLAVFKKWVESDILPVDRDDCSENLLLLPWTFGQPDYRDLYRERPTWIGKGFFWYYISPYSQAPEMILPIGQTRFHSRVTDKEEWLPVSLGVIASKDNDIQLAELIQEMYHSIGLNTTVMTGRTAFEVQEEKVGKAEDINEQGSGLQGPLRLDL